jgi:hypothetical protein
VTNKERLRKIASYCRNHKQANACCASHLDVIFELTEVPIDETLFGQCVALGADPGMAIKWTDEQKARYIKAVK